jgi:hypothetical protein
MIVPGKIQKLVQHVAMLLASSALAFAAPMMSRDTTGEDKSQAHSQMPQTECTFSDGSSITFGRKAAGTSGGSGGDAWRTGPYKATVLRVSEGMLIPPLDRPTKIPAGRYTLFVIDKGEPPWTLIISKKIGEWGMPYPGEYYDLGRVQLGSDVQPPVENFTIGCMEHKDTSGPIFVWMQSGTKAAYAKIMAESISKGKTIVLAH